MFARFQKELEDNRNRILKFTFLSVFFALAGAALTFSGFALDLWSFAAGVLMYPATKLVGMLFDKLIQNV